MPSHRKNNKFPRLRKSFKPTREIRTRPSIKTTDYRRGFQFQLSGAGKWPLHPNNKERMNEQRLQPPCLSLWEEAGHGAGHCPPERRDRWLQGVGAHRSWHSGGPRQVPVLAQDTWTACDRFLEARSAQLREETNWEREAHDTVRLTFGSSTRLPQKTSEKHPHLHPGRTRVILKHVGALCSFWNGLTPGESRSLKPKPLVIIGA